MKDIVGSREELRRAILSARPAGIITRLDHQENYGFEVAKARRKLGINKGALAKRLGVVPSIVGMIESGSLDSYVLYTEKIEEVLGVKSSATGEKKTNKER